MAQSGQHATALGYFDEGLNLAKEDRDRRSQSQLTLRVGKLAEAMGADARALHSFESGLVLSRRLDYRRLEIKFLRLMA